jgi:glycerol-3-phosphate dehydrogenase (NAD(P)+)
MELSDFHARAREHGVNPFVYWPVRAVLQPFFLLYFRLTRLGREHVPQSGPLILAANHRSFLDPFVIATLIRRPIYFVAKKELFARRWQGWLLNALGAFPVDRGASDADMIASAQTILARGDCVLIFPEGTRIRPGSLGSPKRGVGRLALEAGVPVLPVAVIGTEAVRRGWRVRPHRVRIRCGRVLRFPHVADPSPALAATVTDRIWACVMLQWEWLGGLPPLRRAAVIGAGAWGTALAVALARAGLEVDLGCRTVEQAESVDRERENSRHLPGVELPDTVAVCRAADLKLAAQDLVCFAVPSGALPAAVAAHGPGVPSRAGVLVVSKGVAPPLGTLPSAYVAERVRARATACLAGPAHAAAALEHGAALVVASHDRGLTRQLDVVLAGAGFEVHRSADVTGVELAGAAKNAATLAACAAAPGGPNAAGAAAGKVFAELQALAHRRGADPQTFCGLAGTGDLVATVLASHSRNRRAGELLASGVPAGEIAARLGATAEAVESIPLLALMAREHDVSAPALEGLAELLAGRIEPDSWSRELTAPAAERRSVRAA